MNNKVLILDDRVERKKSLMNDLSLERLEECVNNNWLTIVTCLPTNKDRLEELIRDYSLIAIHRSWLAERGVENAVEDIMKRNDKYYVEFSGGISQNLLMWDGKRLNMNAANFYTDNLPIIIEKLVRGDVDFPLIELLYGISWRLSFLLEYRNIIWLDDFKTNMEKMKRKDEIESVLQLSSISMEGIEKEIEKEKYKFVLL